MGLGKNRSLMNLQQNPFAVYIIMEPGKGLMDWKGYGYTEAEGDCDFRPGP